jgi:hypothetical protein
MVIRLITFVLAGRVLDVSSSPSSHRGVVQHLRVGAAYFEQATDDGEDYDGRNGDDNAVAQTIVSVQNHE